MLDIYLREYSYTMPEHAVLIYEQYGYLYCENNILTALVVVWYGNGLLETYGMEIIFILIFILYVIIFGILLDAPVVLLYLLIGKKVVTFLILRYNQKRLIRLANWYFSVHHSYIDHAVSLVFLFIMITSCAIISVTVVHILQLPFLIFM